MRRLIYLCLLFLFFFLLLGGVSAEARSVICNVPATHPNIQAAIDDTTCTDINVAAGYYTGPALDLAVNRTLAIRGAGSTGSASVATYLNYRVLVTNDAVVTLENLSIDALGPPHGVELSSNSAGVIANNVNIYGSLGFGVFDTFGANTGNTFATLSNCNIYGNAGGVNVVALDMTNCEVYSNNIYGGIQINADSTIRDSDIYNNQLDWNDQGAINEPQNEDGAGILFAPSSSASTLLIENSTIHDNTTTTHSPNTIVNSDGGGLAVQRGDVTVRNSEIYNNVAGRYGGGIHVHYTFDSSLTLENSTIRDNVAYDGGGGISIGNDTTILNSTIRGNTARFDANINGGGFAAGGGIYVSDSADAIIRNTTIEQNETDSVGATMPVNSGGGLYVAPNFSGGALTLEQSTISDNYAQNDGGGVYVREGVVLRNVTIANNRADNDGGGAYGEGLPSFLYNMTVVGNSADDDSDGSGDGGGVAGVLCTSHALIALNVDPSTEESADCHGGSVISLGYSIMGITDGCPNFKSGTDMVGDVGSPLDPKVVLPLTNHGGQTETIALDKGSPAIDAGEAGCNGTSEDQRGYGRTAQDGNGDDGDGNNCDIGAYEVSTAVPTAIALRGQHATSGGLWMTVNTFLLLAVWTMITVYNPRYQRFRR